MVLETVLLKLQLKGKILYINIAIFYLERKLLKRKTPLIIVKNLRQKENSLKIKWPRDQDLVQGIGILLNQVLKQKVKTNQMTVYSLLCGIWMR